MEIIIKENNKNKMVFDVKGVTHGFANVLKEQIQKDSHTKIASYRVDHPLVGVPTFMVETDGKATPKSVLSSAVKKLDAFADKLKKEIGKIK